MVWAVSMIIDGCVIVQTRSVEHQDQELRRFGEIRPALSGDGETRLVWAEDAAGLFLNHVLRKNGNSPARDPIDQQLDALSARMFNASRFSARPPSI